MSFELFNHSLLQNEKMKELLKHCPFQILNQFELEHFEMAGSFFFQQNHFYQNTYILLKGTIEIFLMSDAGKKIVIDTYHDSGLFIGEQEALLDVPYSSCVRNTSSISVLKLSNHAFLDWIEMDHVLTKNLLKFQCTQVYHLARQTGQYTLYNAKEQVAIAILHLRKNNIPITRSELIGLVATTPRHLNRILADLSDKGIIKIGNSLIDINNVDKLAFYGES